MKDNSEIYKSVTRFITFQHYLPHRAVVLQDKV
ncbi:unnamed protein product, partial [Larinioides sclopetarius]